MEIGPKRIRRTTGLAGMLLALASGAACAAGTRAATGLDAAPEPIRQYLQQAERADAIADPLERCIAFPDVPGNQWPAGLTRAHCELSFGPRITLEQASALLDAGKLEELDALYARDLERHFSDERSEAIHRDFDDLDANHATGRFTHRWLEKAPNSAYALAARAVYYRMMAGEARGEKFAADTPPENLQRMSEFLDLAVDHYRRALEIEPRLLPAYSGLVSAAKMDSRAELEQWAVSTGLEIDPGCRSLSGNFMVSITPRWGGSYGQMEAFARALEPMVPERPLLALNTIWPHADRADRLYADDRYEEALQVLRPVLPRTTHPELYEDAAASIVALDDRSAEWEALMYFVAASRYDPGRAYIARNRGRLLLWLAERPEWAIRHLTKAAELAPHNASVQLMLGTAHGRLGRYEEAEAFQLRALEDADYRQRALRDLVENGLYAKSESRARKYSEMWVREFPDDVHGWLARLDALSMDGTVQPTEMQDASDASAKVVSLTEKTSDTDLLRARRQVIEFQTELKRAGFTP